MSAEKLYSILCTPRAYINYWVHEKQVNILDDGESKCSALVLDYIGDRQKYREYRGGIPIVTHSARELISAYDEHADQVNARLLAGQTRQLEFTGAPDLEEMSRWVEVVTGDRDPVDVAVIAHFMWQIKRKFMGLQGINPIAYPLMPVVFGESGAGKSWAVLSLIQPFRDMGRVWENVTFPQIADERQAYQLKYKYVSFVDELMGIENLESQEKFKAISSGSTVPARRLGYNKYDDVPQNTTFIGTSNYPLIELKLKKGMPRRMAQITARPKDDLLPALKSFKFDAWKAFRGIDENRKNGYIESVEKELAVRQEATDELDSLKMFVAQHKIKKPSKGGPVREIPMLSMYNSYSEFCRSYEIPAESLKKLSSYLVNHKGAIRNQKTKAGKQTTYVLVDACCDVVEVGSSEVVSLFGVK